MKFLTHAISTEYFVQERLIYELNSDAEFEIFENILHAISRTTGPMQEYYCTYLFVC